MSTINWYRKAGDLVFQGKTGQIIKGVFNATTAGYGLTLTGTRQWIERGNADDGGAVLTTAGAYLFGSRRLLLTAAQTGSNSYFGGCDRLSIAADCSASSAEMAGHWAMLEVKSGGKTGSQASCYRADLNIASGSVVSSGITSCFLAAAEKLSQTTTSGRVTVIHVPNPQAGTFTNFAEFGSATGCISAASVGATAALQILIRIGGSAYAIPVCAVGT
jgi:hypothetical protein